MKPHCDVPALWQEHRQALYSFIVKRVKDPEVANDLLQDVLLKVYDFCLAKTGVKNIKSWLFQIAHNTIADYYRKNQRFTEFNETHEAAAEDVQQAFQEAADYILPLLNFLPEAYATPLKMADIDNMKQADIARQLGLSLPATKSRIQRARQLLMAEFMTCCHYETDGACRLISFSIKASCTPLQQVKKSLRK